MTTPFVVVSSVYAASGLLGSMASEIPFPDEAMVVGRPATLRRRLASRFASFASAAGATIVVEASSLTQKSGSAFALDTGGTTIAAGRLELAGSLAAASAVTVEAGGALSGIGNAAGPVTISGVLAPGSGGAGTLTTGALALATGANLAWNLGGASGPHDLVNAAVLAFTGSPAVHLHLTGTNPAAPGQPLAIPLVSTSGGISGFGNATFVIYAEEVDGEPADFAVQVQGNVLVLSIAPKGSANAWQAWQELHFGDQAGDSSISGPNADPDGDGVPNRAEMVLGLDPNDSNSRLKLSLTGMSATGTPSTFHQQSPPELMCLKPPTTLMEPGS